MIWLTRVRVSTIEAAKLRLSDSYAWHQTLWRAFPGREDEKRDFLTRVDRREQFFEALILSPVEPTPQTWGRWQTKQVAPSFLEHSRYRFALRANPTVKRVVRCDGGNRKKNGCRTAICDLEELKTWLKTKGEAGGFSIETVDCDPPVRESFFNKNKRGTHARVDFQGVLVVTDGKQFQKTFQHGIGTARAFGFGLMLLQPIA
jgi:CRISPR system Cascade subunit CasE